ncbi:hypothetical protein M0813_10801 [Anaeramoeba flamelloides]|uniref:Glycerophosphocholine acyltransferase 1 n=1 Tax=Anaeramoeba flamelloides TaxID=1746091 RepID=A0ABQ8X204_9EUKA|nr:hypothetical protein M0813_10801 [Anaeramoeba flamelloides]
MKNKKTTFYSLPKTPKTTSKTTPKTNEATPENEGVMDAALDQFGDDLDDAFKDSFDRLELSVHSISGFREALYGEKSKLFKIFDQGKDELKNRAKHIIEEEITSKMETHEFQSFVTKFAFLLGVFGLIFSEAIFFTRPFWFPKYYTLCYFPLVGLRYYLYKKKNLHYFLLDFCYWVNSLLLIFIYLYRNKLFFLMVFASVNGPVLTSISFWKNSMVFHSLTKITSLFIHLFPAMVTYVLRWIIIGDDICLRPDCKVSFAQTIGFSMVLYFIWQLFYFIKTEIINESRKNKDELMTSFIWQKTHNSMNKILLLRFPEKYHVYLYMFYQSIYHALTMLPVKFMFQYKIVHSIAIIFQILVSIRNGASFYFDFVPTKSIFSQKKREQAEKEKMLRKKAKKIEKNSEVREPTEFEQLIDSQFMKD